MTYKLFSTCILSKGYNISLIIDIQRDSYFKIPNSLYDILCNIELLDFDSINEFYNNNKIIREYFTFLKENELIITSRREWLPDGRSGRIGVHSKLYKDVQYRDKGRNDDGDFINRCVRKGCKVIEISCPLKPISNSITN